MEFFLIGLFLIFFTGLFKNRLYARGIPKLSVLFMRHSLIVLIIAFLPVFGVPLKDIKTGRIIYDDGVIGIFLFISLVFGLISLITFYKGKKS